MNIIFIIWPTYDDQIQDGGQFLHHYSIFLCNIPTKPENEAHCMGLHFILSQDTKKLYIFDSLILLGAIKFKMADIGKC